MDVKIAVDHLLRRLRNARHGAICRQLAAHRIDDCEEQADENDVPEGDLGGKGDVVARKGNTKVLRKQVQEQRHTTGDDKRHQQKEGEIMSERADKSAFYFHRIITHKC